MTAPRSVTSGASPAPSYPSSQVEQRLLSAPKADRIGVPEASQGTTDHRANSRTFLALPNEVLDEYIGYLVTERPECRLPQRVDGLRSDRLITGEEERKCQWDELRILKAPDAAHRHPLNIGILRGEALAQGLDTRHSRAAGVLLFEHGSPQHRVAGDDGRRTRVHAHIHVRGLLGIARA